MKIFVFSVREAPRLFKICLDSSLPLRMEKSGPSRASKAFLCFGDREPPLRARRPALDSVSRSSSVSVLLLFLLTASAALLTGFRSWAAAGGAAAGSPAPQILRQSPVATNRLPASPVLDTDRWTIPLDQGASVFPFCNSYAAEDCVRQVSHFARPFAVYPAGGARPPSPELFMPVLLPDSFLPHSTSMQGWEILPSFSSSFESADIQYYQSSDSRWRGRIRRIQTDDKGEIKSIDEGDLAYVSLIDIESTPAERAANKAADAPVKAIVTRGTAAAPARVAPPASSALEKSTGAVSGESEQARAPGSDPKSSDEADDKAGESAGDSEESGSAAVPHEQGNSSKAAASGGSGDSGCVEPPPPDELEAQAICQDCLEDNPHLAKTVSAVSMEKLQKFLKAVAFGNKDLSDDDFGDKGRQGDEERRKFAQSGSQQRIAHTVRIGKICEPGKALEQIVSRFNQTCRPKHSFDRFFSDMYCQSCEAGIPPEIMPSMMSIESAGRCVALLENKREASIGLFQINSKEHSCKGNRKGSDANKRCLLEPANNLEYGIKVLEKHYNELNDPPLAARGGGSVKAGVCSDAKPWSERSAKEKDKWRRAVSGYNGGSGWVDRAIQSVEGAVDKSGKAKGRDPRQSTDDLEGTHKKGLENRAKKSRVSWEELRLYFFMEKLIPGNTKSTGRHISLTVSNIAHTEAVLGRGSLSGGARFDGARSDGAASFGLADYWERFIQEKKPFSCP